MYFKQLFDLFIDRILSVTDYFIIKKHVTLTEGFFFAIALKRALWLTIFSTDVISAVPATAHVSWAPVFWIVCIAHVVSCFLSNKIRAGVMLVYAMLWGTLSVLSAMAAPTSLALPSFGVFALFNTCVAVRLWFESNESNG